VSAKAAFPRDCRVKMAQVGRDHFGITSDRGTTGQVVGYSWDDRLIRVHRDGYKTALNYAPVCWEVVPS
jgi:hypothetical protein